MEITALTISTLKGYDKVGKTESEPGKGKGIRSSPKTGDSVKISDQAKLYNEALAEARDTPDVRRKKVDELRALVQSGEYKPDLRKTAAKIVEEDLEMLL